MITRCWNWRNAGQDQTVVLSLTDDQALRRLTHLRPGEQLEPLFDTADLSTTTPQPVRSKK